MDGKKSFLLYCDQISLFDQLPDKEAGKLIKLIFAYVNDENPKIDDLLLKIAFEPIKLQLKRDLEGWNKIVKRNRNNGAKGGRPRNPDKPNKPSGLSGNSKEPKKPDKDKDTDTVNDIDNETDNDTLFKIEIKPPILTDFLDYARVLCERAGLQYKDLIFSLEQKYQTWVDAGWKDGHGSEIKNWKNKLGNTLPHLKAINSNQQYGKPERRDGFDESERILLKRIKDAEKS